MFRNRRDEFHESYYDHACLILTERDVLDTEISGDGWKNQFKRFWYDLILLSYSNESAGDCYHSTHGMRMDRTRHYHRYLGCIHPLSKFRTFWSAFMLYGLMFYKITVFSLTSFIAATVPKPICYLSVVFEACMLLDLYINARTGFIDSVTRKVILDKQFALLHYCSTKLFFHSVTAIPFVFIMFLRYGKEINCTICRSNYFNCVISFSTVISFFRLYELSSYWNRFRKSKEIFFHFLRLVVILIFSVIQFLHVRDTVSLVRVMTNKSLGNGEDAYYKDLVYIKHSNMFSDAIVSYNQFWRILHFLMNPCFKIDELKDDIYTMYPLLTLAAYGLQSISFVWIFIEGVNCMTRKRYFDDEKERSKNYLLHLVKSRQLPDEFRSRINQYYNYNEVIMTLMEEKKLSRHLPEVLKHEILWHSYSRLINRIPYFTDWPIELIEKLVIMEKQLIYLEHDLIADVGLPGEGLMIVYSGVLAVYTSQKVEVGHLIDGDYFGELSLVTDQEVRTSSFVAVSKCKVLLLEKIRFRQLMRSYPELFYAMRDKIFEEYREV